jgi:hypothetical protein
VKISWEIVLMTENISFEVEFLSWHAVTSTIKRFGDIDKFGTGVFDLWIQALE